MFRFLFLSFFFCLNLQAQDKFEVFFDSNKSEINSEVKSKLDSLISNKKNIQIIKIYGYADIVGSNEYNDSLSLKRAENVYEYFKANDIQMNDGVEIKGFGENLMQSGSQFKNRKVLISFMNFNIAKGKETFTEKIKETLTEKE